MSSRRFQIALLLLLPVGSLLTVSAADRACSCPHCGSCELRSVCRIVPSIQKGSKTVYGCKEQELCLPGRSRNCGRECVSDCKSSSGFRYVTRRFPTCGRIICKKTLTKRTVTEEKEVLVCKVLKVCCCCGAEFDPENNESEGGKTP